MSNIEFLLKRFRNEQYNFWHYIYFYNLQNITHVYGERDDSHWQGVKQKGGKDYTFSFDDGVICGISEASPSQRYFCQNLALGLEDYKLIIKKPTDLNLIRRQYNEGKYKFVEEVLDEIQLCWDNCKLYNAIGS